MPQRTNDYQKLVALIQRLYAPKGAVITESAMVKTASGQKREVDIFVEFQTELYSFRVAVEAKDLSRPIETTTLEQYIGKYNSRDGIAVNNVIIVGKAFAQTVQERAKSLEFDLHTLSSLESEVTGQFSNSHGEFAGGWWIGEGLGKKIDLSLLNKFGKTLCPKYYSGQFRDKGKNSALGSVNLWARDIINGYLGEQIDRLYQEHAGEEIQAIVEITLDHHTVERRGFRPVPVHKILLNFGKRMRLPEMQAQASKLSTGTGDSRIIVHEKGLGKNASVNIVYEEKENEPRNLYLHSESPESGVLESKKVELRFNFKEMSREAVTQLITEASKSW